MSEIDDTTIDAYPRVGEVLEDKYEIKKLLGAGAMGAVFSAQHLLRRVPVALKFVSPSVLGQRDVIERFLNEGVAASKIDNEHVVKVFDVSRMPNGQPYMVMEMLDGEDLYNLMRREGQPWLPDITRAVHFVLQILRGLQAAHRVGIVHRDMKPANCFIVRKDGEPDFIKIVDFGISKVKPEGTGELELTQANSALGTPLYMSLEQARSPKDVDARTDLYSVSVILYELVCGVTPFVPMSGTLMELFSMLATEEPKPIETHRPDAPPGLGDVILKGLSKAPKDRFQSAEEMAEALSHFSDQRSDHVVSRLLKTVQRTGKTRPPPSLSTPAAGPVSIAPGGVSGTVMMTGSPGALSATVQKGPMSQAPPAVPQAAPPETVANTAQGVERDRRSIPESKRGGAPFAFAIAIVAVGAVAAAAWALGKVSQQPAPTAEKTVVIQQVGAPPASAGADATPTPTPAPTQSVPHGSETAGSATVVSRPSGAPAPSASASSRPLLKNIGRD